jgi:peptide/nickel transport system substrate-binding protein
MPVKEGVPMVHTDAHDESGYASANDLIQARRAGKISRREMLGLATKLGISASVFGVMLHATSDMAFGAPVNRGNGFVTRFQDGQPVPVTAATAPEGTPQQGGQIIIGTTEEPDTLHPYLTQLVTGFDVWVGIFDTLIEYDATQTLQPSLAESWEISDDGLSYTFHLRQGVTFHDGAPLTSADVKASWEIIMNPDFGAYNTLGWREIVSLDTPDDLTVVMSTATPYAPFLSYVGASNAIVPKAAVDKGIDSFKQEFGRAPYGTGSFKFSEWKAKQSITLTKNEAYWGGAPYLDTIVYTIIPDSNTFMVQLKTGEIDLAGSAGNLSAQQVDEALGIDGLTVYEHSGQSWSHLDLKIIGHLRQTKVRQALDFATPTDQIINQLLKGRATPSIADQAPGTWAYDETVTPRPFDLDQAAQLLTEAGLTKNGDGIWEGPTPAGDPTYPGQLYAAWLAEQGSATPEAAASPVAAIFQGTDDAGATNLTGPVMPLEIELWGLAGDDQSQQVLEIINAAWTQLGVKSSTNFQDVSTIWGPDGYQWNDKTTACFYSWTNSNDPDDMFYWESTNIPDSPTGTGGNAICYFYPFSFQTKIDELTRAGAVETDQAKREEIYSQIQALLHEEAPCIFMYWASQFPVAKNNIGGYWPNAFNNLLWNAEKWYLV